MNTQKKWQRMIDARKAVHRAAVEYEQAARSLFRIGTKVHWDQGVNPQHGVVLDFSFGADRLKVRAASGKEYWVHTSRIIASKVGSIS